MAYGLPQFPNQMPQRSWWSRVWPVALPMGGCFATACACIALLGGVLISGVYALRGSEPAATGVRAVETSNRAKLLLGEPITSGWIVTGTMNVSGPDGTVNITLPVHGPKASGKVTVQGTRRNAAWFYSAIFLVMDSSGERVVLSTTPGPR
jgi:hypothetical protein